MAIAARPPRDGLGRSIVQVCAEHADAQGVNAAEPAEVREAVRMLLDRRRPAFVWRHLVEERRVPELDAYAAVARARLLLAPVGGVVPAGEPPD